MLSRHSIVIGVLMLTPVLFGQPASAADDPLASWTEGPSKKAITDFVAKATTDGSPDFVKPEERIAVFDNDGTLW